MAFRTQTFEITALHSSQGLEHATAHDAREEQALVDELAERGFTHLSTKRTSVYRLGDVLKVRIVSDLVERHAAGHHVRIGNRAGMLFSRRRRRNLDLVWHTARMELGVPVLVLDWAEDRAKIHASVERLHAAVADLSSEHPARMPLLGATVVIDQWLARWPATTDPQAEDPDPRSIWNDQISLELQEIWSEVQSSLSGRG